MPIEYEVTPHKVLAVFILFNVQKAAGTAMAILVWHSDRELLQSHK